MSNVIALNNRGWTTAAELANALNVSTRTIYRRVNRGEIEARETDNGTRYRLTPTDGADSRTDTGADTDSHDRATDTGADSPKAQQSRAVAPTDTADTDTDKGRHDTAIVTALIDRLETGAVERGRLEAERDRLAAELEEWQAFALEAVEAVERLRGY